MENRTFVSICNSITGVLLACVFNGFGVCDSVYSVIHSFFIYVILFICSVKHAKHVLCPEI